MAEDQKPQLLSDPLYHPHFPAARSQWHELIGDPTLADGVLDRLVHNAHRIEPRDESSLGCTTPVDEMEDARQGLMCRPCPAPQSRLILLDPSRSLPPQASRQRRCTPIRLIGIAGTLIAFLQEL